MSTLYLLAQSSLARSTNESTLSVAFITFAALCIVSLFIWMTTRYIPNHLVGVVEKLWSTEGSVAEGCIIALNGEAGYQADVLRGGFHFKYPRWQYRIHRVKLVTIPQGKIGYIYARDGEALEAGQTLGRVVDCNNFQDAYTFLTGRDNPRSSSDDVTARGQRGRQRAILREGAYAVNPAIFVVVTEDAVYALRRVQNQQEISAILQWQKQLLACDGFSPVIVGAPVMATDPIHPERSHEVDSIGIVTIHDGPSLPPGEIIAPPVGTLTEDANYHNNFQDPEAFLRAGGRRGRQLLPLTDGTYFINRWFASIEMAPKTIVPIGYVGVVVSYYGRTGRDVSGAGFRHGELVSEGERGVGERPLGPGKYAFNRSAGSISLVPTTNFVLHWITGRSETHRYDESLKSIDLVTRDAYEPLLPLSVVVHIDYQRAPSVVQRFGDVQKLITQTLDPLLSAYFRDIAHKKTMLELLHERDQIQKEALCELRRRFREFDIECVDVLIGKPDTAEKDGKIEGLLEQLRLRQLSIEQLETYERQCAAAEKLKMLNEAQAEATMQTQLTNARVQVRIADSQAEAELAKARRQAEQTVVVAEADLARSRRQAEQTVILAEAQSRQKILEGKGEAQAIMQTGLSEAAVLLRKIHSFGDPRLFALSGLSEQITHSTQPLVPQRVFIAGGDGASAGNGQGLLGLLVNLLVAEKSGFALAEGEEMSSLKEFADRMAQEAMDSVASKNGNGSSSA
jgi:uncharacterized membrane protein YqiK